MGKRSSDDTSIPIHYSILLMIATALPRLITNLPEQTTTLPKEVATLPERDMKSWMLVATFRCFIL